MEAFETEAMKIEDELIERHDSMLAEYEEMLHKEVPDKPKHSAEILNLKRIETELAKQKE